MYVFNSGLEQNDEGRISEGWEMLQNNIERISKFVKEFLDFARGRLPDVSLIDPNLPAKRVFELFHEKAAMEGVKIVTDWGSGLEEAPLDEDVFILAWRTWFPTPSTLAW